MQCTDTHVMVYMYMCVGCGCSLLLIYVFSLCLRASRKIDSSIRLPSLSKVVTYLCLIDIKILFKLETCTKTNIKTFKALNETE